MIRFQAQFPTVDWLPRMELRPIARTAGNVVHLDRVRIKTNAPALLPLHTIRLSSLGADLLLPAVGATPAETFAIYKERLADSEIFGSKSCRILDSVKLEASPPFDREQPVVGIVMNRPEVFDGSGGLELLTGEMNELGMRTVLIPPCADLVMPKDPAGRANGLRSLVQRLDGFIGPGGPDVDPSIYHRKNRYSRDTNVRRDRFEADLAIAAKDEALFMFAICRSHQLWSAADGGELHQDVRREGLASTTRNQDRLGIPGDQPLIVRDAKGEVRFDHLVRVAPGTRMADVTRALTFRANAFHHQAVKKSGADLEVIGSSHDPKTGRDMVEATERWNAFTVQWHPEAMWNDPLQRRLLGTVARRASLFRAAKNLQNEGKRLESSAIIARGTKIFGWLDPSDARWVRHDLVPFLWARSPRFPATEGVAHR